MAWQCGDLLGAAVLLGGALLLGLHVQTVQLRGAGGDGGGGDGGGGEGGSGEGVAELMDLVRAEAARVVVVVRACAARSSMRLSASGDLGDVASCRRALSEALAPSGERTVQPSSSWMGMVILVLAPYSCLSSRNCALVICEGGEEG